MARNDRFPTVDLSVSALRHLLDLYANFELRGEDAASGDWYLDYVNFVIAGRPESGLDMVLSLAELADDDEALCWVGVNFVEPLLDIHWRQIGERFEREARRRPKLRKALSCAWLDIRPHGKSKGAMVESRLRALIQPGENIGGPPE